MFKLSIRNVIRHICITQFIVAFSVGVATAQNAEEGKKIFEGQCVSCHDINEKVVGPALKDVHKRREEAWLLKWVKNSQAMVKAGDPTAVKLFAEYNGSVMNSFDFTDAQVKDVMAYIKAESEAPAAPAVSAGTATGSQATTQVPSTAPGAGFYNSRTMWILVILSTVLLLISLLLLRISGVLKTLISTKFPQEAEPKEPSYFQRVLRPWWVATNKTVFTVATLTVFGLIGFIAYFGYANTEIGVQQGYAPTQPINFSHELHAGQYKIDCQFCHTTASKSKQASVPAVSTCMNCHKHVDAKAKYDGEVSPEIQKIRDAYNNNEPIQWVRIHNLPDHAYFNHSQHVSVGKVECQTCHGPVEKMEKVAQHASLQMGWCVNCHREAEVDVANNDYYEQVHAELRKQGRKTITVARNGGLDCGKCHY